MTYDISVVNIKQDTNFELIFNSSVSGEERFLFWPLGKFVCMCVCVCVCVWGGGGGGGGSVTAN